MDDMPEFSWAMPKTRRRSPNEIYGEMADAGDFEALVKAFGTTMQPLYGVELFFPLLQRAIEVASRTDPIEFSRRMFADMLAFTALLGVRARLTAQQILTQLDTNCGPRFKDHWLREGPAREALVSLWEIQGHLATLLQADASTARTWQLAQLRQNPGATEGGSSTQRPCKPGGKQSATRIRRRRTVKPIRRSKFVPLNGNGKLHGNCKAT
jgi:hypothetical protein